MIRNAAKPFKVIPKSNLCASLAFSSSSSPPTPQINNDIPSKLTWTEFFNMRKSRKLWERGTAGFTGFCSFAATTYYTGAVMDFDPTHLIFGMMDPTMAYAIASFGVGAVGYAAGTVVGNGLWNMKQSGVIKNALDDKEKDFFEKIKNNRPRVFKTNIQNPYPDYYGEKIGSVADYRKWLKKQREWRVKTGMRLDE